MTRLLATRSVRVGQKRCRTKPRVEKYWTQALDAVTLLEASIRQHTLSASPGIPIMRSPARLARRICLIYSEEQMAKAPNGDQLVNGSISQTFWRKHASTNIRAPGSCNAVAFFRDRGPDCLRVSGSMHPVQNWAS